MSEFADVRALVDARDIQSALALIGQIERNRGSSPRLAVLKAQCLQLSEDASLEDVETALNAAVSMDDEYVDGYLELGWFRLMVLDDPSGAKSSFRQAAELLAKRNEEAVEGLLACDAELPTGFSPKEEYQRLLLGAAHLTNSSD